MSEGSMIIKSHKGEYQVDFSNNGAKHLVDNLPDRNYHIIIDQHVAELYQDQLKDVMQDNSVLMIEAKEQNKTLESMPTYVTHLLEKQVRRDDILIAVGLLHLS